MAQVANSPGEYSLGALNDATPWLQLSGLSDDVGFTIEGPFVATVELQVSNQGDATKTRTRTIDTYTSTAGPLAIPREAGRWFRFIVTAYTSGTAYIDTTAPNISETPTVTLLGQTVTNVPGEDGF